MDKEQLIHDCLAHFIEWLYGSEINASSKTCAIYVVEKHTLNGIQYAAYPQQGSYGTYRDTFITKFHSSPEDALSQLLGNILYYIEGQE